MCLAMHSPKEHKKKEKKENIFHAFIERMSFPKKDKKKCIGKIEKNENSTKAKKLQQIFMCHVWHFPDSTFWRGSAKFLEIAFSRSGTQSERRGEKREREGEGSRVCALYFWCPFGS